ncbi:SUMF1/EgtB/PvdO family nonheme iron enzyme, partial [Bacillus pumilus]|uniref:SUMF1/EgtB/PvdO family nonheme iron enzyme n=1 Tax=Bacillus pumilus TaxID=1408 RepID=UPI00331460D5
GGLNDRAAITAEVTSFLPNGFGLYNMSGNVSEWVADIYRPLSPLEVDGLNPFRGNKFSRDSIDQSQGIAVIDAKGRVEQIPEKDEDLKNRRNYQRAYAVDYMDGDSASGVTYGYGITTLISDKSRVYKGGSWNDQAYWLSPGTRR